METLQIERHQCHHPDAHVQIRGLFIFNFWLAPSSYKLDWIVYRIEGKIEQNDLQLIACPWICIHPFAIEKQNSCWQEMFDGLFRSGLCWIRTQWRRRFFFHFEYNLLNFVLLEINEIKLQINLRLLLAIIWEWKREKRKTVRNILFEYICLSERIYIIIEAWVIQ